MVPLNIFICYKKVLTREKDGHVIEQRSSKAPMLHMLLSQAADQYAPWMDEAELGAGMAWETEIYSRILISDVLLVLIGIGTSKSQWVQREIALATALGVSVVPLGCDLTWDEMTNELKALKIEHLQAKITNNISVAAGDALRSELRGDLLRAAEGTRKKQEEILPPILSRRRVKSPKAADRQVAAKFALQTPRGSLAISVASGDISKIRGIDAIVNSENDYMQMARFFEVTTISSVLRRLGAVRKDGRYYDLIQSELDYQLKDRVRPVQPGEAFVTSAGGPASDLARVLKARYIIHVAAVQTSEAEAKVVPFGQPHQIEACVRSTLSKILELNEMKGIVSPPGTPQREEQEKRASASGCAIKSVIMPLFGTGHGGSSPEDVLGPMLQGVRTFFEDLDEGADSATPTEIYLSAYSDRDVRAVVDFLTRATA